jgi:uncharacterized protein (TIGR00725 family)
MQLAVIGGASCTPQQEKLAYETGSEIARRGAVLLCGGRGGVMEAASRGARDEGGRTVGILPGESAVTSPPNPHIELALFTGMGQARNQVLVLSAQGVIGIGGSWGTLTEIGLALKHGIPVVLLESWQLEPPDGEPEPLLMSAQSPTEAVELAMAAAKNRTHG